MIPNIYNILIVDDNPDNLFTLELLLKKIKNCNIIKALTGEAALTATIEHSIDLVLLDIQMPGMDGYETAKHLKMTERTREIPIVFLTAVYRADEFIRRGYEVGAIDYLTKPLDDNQLINRIILYKSLWEREVALKAALIKLKESSEASFHDLFEGSMDGIILINMDGSFIDINVEALEMFGFGTKQEMLSKHIVDLSPQYQQGHSNSQELFEKFLLDIRKKGSLQFEWDYQRKNGSVFTADVLMNTINWRGGIAAQASLRDITEKKQAQEVLKRYKKVIDTSIDGFILTDKQGVIVDVNESYSKIVGYKAEELIGEKISKLEGNEKNQDEVLQHLKTIMINKMERFETIHIHKSSHEVPVEVSVTYIPESEQLYAFVRDLSHQKAVEKTLRDTKELAEQATRAKSSFLANMSHEIRTPMNGIIGLSNIVLNEEISPRVREYISKISISSQSLLGILNDILDFSKLEAGRLGIEKRPFTLSGVLENIKNLFEERARAKSLDFFIEVSPETPNGLMGDDLRIQQIMANIVGNAIKFTEKGKIQVKIFASDIKGKIIKLNFVVTDTGIGIAANSLNKLFEPFNQLDNSITRKFGGTGLGLAISLNLLELMGGTIKVTSVPGVGSEFAFEIPLEKSDQVEDSKRIHHTNLNMGDLTSFIKEKGAKLNGIRALVAEDDLTNQLVIRKFLSLAGIVPTIVNNGQQILEYLEKDEFDIILMDIQMPILDGIETSRFIRQNKKLSEIPIIALTAGVTPRERENCYRAGMNDFIPKPFNAAILIDTLNRWIKSKEAKS